LFFFILGVKFDSDMSETPKKKTVLCERRTISFDADLYALALHRMKEEGETMFSRYVQALVRKDTAALRAQALKGTLESPLEIAPAKRQANATAPLVQPTKVFYGQKKTDRKPRG
jgi:hypothetical protein